MDLKGITTIYSRDENSYVSLGNKYGEMYVVHGGHEYFSTFYDMPGVSLQNSGRTFLRALDSKVVFPGVVKMNDDVSFAEGVYLEGEVKLASDCRARGLLATYSGGDAYCIEVLGWGFRIREWDTRMDRWGDIVGDVEWSR